MAKQRVTYNKYLARADCVEVVIDEDDFFAWTKEIGMPLHLKQVTEAGLIHRYVEDRDLKPEVGEGSLEFDDAADLELLGEEEEVISGQSLDKDEVKELVKTALNSGRGDTEWATLVQLGDMVGLEYNEEEDRYE